MIHTSFCEGTLCECSHYMYVALLPWTVTGVNGGVSEGVKGSQLEACVGPLLEQEHTESVQQG